MTWSLLVFRHDDALTQHEYGLEVAFFVVVIDLELLLVVLEALHYEGTVFSSLFV